MRAPRRPRLAATLAVLVCLALVPAVAPPAAARAPGHEQGPARPPQRIVSLVPATTEMLFAIGAGPQVVAVSSYDRFPPEAATRPRVGALLDPDVERIFSLSPDLVVVYGSQVDLKRQLARAAIPIFDYRHAGLADVFTTLRALGRVTGHAAEAETVAAGVERRLAAVRAAAAGRPAVRTLLVFGREPGALRNIYAAGGTGFLHDMLVAAGGENVFADVARESVQATTEMILARAPAVILELREGEALSEAERARRVSDWARLSSVPAVGQGRVLVVSAPGLVVPGPRVAEAVEHMARALAAARATP